MIITFTNVIGAIRNAFSVVRSGLKMWLGFETSETLGREEVVNGDFSDGTTGWQGSDAATNISISNNRLRLTNGDASAAGVVNSTTTKISFKNGLNYEISYESYQGTSTNKNSQLFLGTTQSGGSSADIFVGEVFTTDGIHKQNFTSTSNQELFLTIKNGITTSGIYMEFDNVSVKELIQYTPDKSGNNNVGELFTGKAIEFDGSTTYVSANGFAGTLSTGDAFTFAVWFNSDTSTDGRNFGNILISSGGANQATNIFKIGVNPRTTPDPGNNKNPGGIYFDDSNGYNNQVPLSGGVNYNDGEWHRLVVSRPSGSGNQDLSFYVDGSYIDKADCNPLWDNMSVFDFGQEWDPDGSSFKTSDHFEGKMSDVQVYDYAWDTDDVTYDYANPNKLAIDNPNTDLVVTNLKGYWAMSEGDGLVAYDSGTNLEYEEVDNGDFSDGTTGWQGSDAAANISISNNRLRLTNGDASAAGVVNSTTTKISFKNGSNYEISYESYQGTSTNKNSQLFLGTTQSGGSSADIFVGEVFTTDGIHKQNFTSTSNQELFLTIKNGITTSGIYMEFDNVSVKELTASDHGGLINGADYVDAQPRIPQLGMMNWAKSTPVADEITLIANPTIPTQDILGNAVRDRLNSFNLDGSGYAEVAEVSGLDVTDFSIEAWVKFDYTNSGSSTNVIYVNGGVSTSVDTFALATNEDNKVMFIVGGVKLFSTTVFSNNNWVHIVGTREGTALKLYINGNKTPEATGTGGAGVNNTSDLLVGRDTQVNRFYKERISDVRLYGAPLSADEVQNNYNAGLSAHRN